MTTNIKTRIDKLEKAKRAAELVKLEVWLIDDDGYCERTGPDGQLIERVTQAELDARNAKQKVRVIKVDMDPNAI